MGSQRLMLNEIPITSFDPAASTVWGMTSAAPGLQHFLTVQHLGQFSGEWILAYVLKSAVNGLDSAAFQNTRKWINAALSANPPDFPLVSIRSGGEGHVLAAYDLESGTAANGGVGDGDYFIYVYDPNQPFSTMENENFPLHQTLEQAQGRIHVMTNNTWTFTGSFASGTNDWSAGMDSLVPLSHSTVPQQHPTLPSLSNLVGALVFASGAVDTVQITDGDGKHLLKPDGSVDHAPGSTIADAAIVPSLTANTGGAKRWPLYAFAHPGVYRHEIRASPAGGAYQAGAITKGFTTMVASGSPAGQAASDQLTFDGPGRALTFASGASKAVAIQLAARADDGSATHVVLLQTDASNGSTDKVSFGPGGSTVRFDHLKGGPAGFQFVLGTVQRMGGVTAFASPALTVAQGDSVVLTPIDWSRLDTSAVSIVISRGGMANNQTLTQPPPVTLSAGPTPEGLLTLIVSAAPIGFQPLAVLEASCAGDASNWIGIGRFDGMNPRKIQANFSLTSKGCSNTPGTTETVLVRALDTQGAVSMIAPLVVTVPPVSH